MARRATTPLYGLAIRWNFPRTETFIYAAYGKTVNTKDKEHAVTSKFLWEKLSGSWSQPNVIKKQRRSCPYLRNPGVPSFVQTAVVGPNVGRIRSSPQSPEDFTVAFAHCTTIAKEIDPVVLARVKPSKTTARYLRSRSLLIL